MRSAPHRTERKDARHREKCFPTLLPASFRYDVALIRTGRKAVRKFRFELPARIFFRATWYGGRGGLSRDGGQKTKLTQYLPETCLRMRGVLPPFPIHVCGVVLDHSTGSEICALLGFYAA